MLLLALTLSARAEPPLPLDPVCAWTDTRWDHYATLYAQGTGVPFAYSRGWSGPTLTGELGFDAWGMPRLRATLTGQGVTVYADVDVNADGIFELFGGSATMGAVTVVEGGELAILGRSGANVLVGPGRWTFDAVTARRVMPYAEVGCERISVWASPSKADAAIVHDAGLPEPQSVRAFAGNRKVTLRDAPRGHVIAVVKRQDWERTVHVLDEKDGWTWVAIPSWQGAVWSGWTDADLVEPGEGGGGGL